MPLSEGNTTILIIVDRFSKAVYFIHLLKLQSSLNTANLLVLHVFKLQGIPIDIDFWTEVESDLLGSGCIGEPPLRLPPTDKRADGAGKPGRVCYC